MLWGGSEGGEPSWGLGQGGGELELDLDDDGYCNHGLGPGGGELELDLDDNSCHDDGVGPGRSNAVTVGIIIKSRAISDSIWSSGVTLKRSCKM